MAKRITTGKRDREKLKEQKRQEKQKRKDERKSGGTSSFEDMIAYVDENGILPVSYTHLDVYKRQGRPRGP